MSENVEKWRCVVSDLNPGGYDAATILALIHVESSGDPAARRPGSQFYGLLQMGRLAAVDAGLKDASGLLGDGHAAIRAFFVYQERYKARHGYDPDKVAYLWKAGPGTLSRANELIRAGSSPDLAFKNAAIEKGVPNSVEYLRRFRDARRIYTLTG